MNELHHQISRQKEQIANQEAVLADLEADVLDLRRDLSDFERRYKRIAEPLAIRLDAVKTALADLEEKATFERFGGHPLGDENPQQSDWELPQGYVPADEQFRRTWHKPGATIEPQAELPIQPKPRETSIKKLYRQLALRYHPDLTSDAGERVTRTALMARINQAYSERNLEALQTLAGQREVVSVDQPLEALQLQELRQINSQLTERISALRIEYSNLLHSEMVRLAMEDRYASSRGRDLLAEIAADLEREYNACMIRLEQLRRH